MAMDPTMKRAVEIASDRASRRAVREVMLNIGINATSPEAARDMQQDLHMIRRLRLASEARAIKVYVALVAAGLSLINTILVLGVQYAFGSPS